jgi:hypothetical protein
MKGFTNEEFFGSLRKDVEDLILSKATKKKVLKGRVTFIRIARSE